MSAGGVKMFDNRDFCPEIEDHKSPAVVDLFDFSLNFAVKLHIAGRESAIGVKP